MLMPNDTGTDGLDALIGGFKKIDLIANALTADIYFGLGNDRDLKWATAAFIDGIQGRECASKHFAKALGKSGLDWMNKGRLFTAHKIFTDNGLSYAQAAVTILALRPALEKFTNKKSIVTLRKELKRRSAGKARLLKNPLALDVYNFSREEIEKCKGDEPALLALALCAIAAIDL